MLTPTDLHILVGVLTRLSRPDGVELELGDMVFDAEAEEDRDVDITIRTIGIDGMVSAYEGIEVKNHSRALDVTHVEQLATKLNDMPSLTNRGIVSASGFTEPAIRKARKKDIQLYEIGEWSAPKKFGTIEFPEELMIDESTYEWATPPDIIINPHMKTTDGLSAATLDVMPIFGTDKRPLKGVDNFGDYARYIARKAPFYAVSQGAQIHIAHDETGFAEFNIILEDTPHLVVNGNHLKLTLAKVSGTLRCKGRTTRPLFKILRMHGDDVPMAGCAIIELSPGNIIGFSVNRDDELRTVNIPVSDRLLNKIYRKKLSVKTAHISRP